MSTALDTSLLSTPKRGKSEAAPAVNAPTSRGKQALKIAAYAGFFLASLSLFTFLKVPDAVVANSLLNFLNRSTAYRWQAEKVAVGFFPLPHLVAEKLSLEPKLRGAGLPLHFDSLKVRPSPLSFLPSGRGPSFGVSFEAEAYKAKLTGFVSGTATTRLELATNGLDLAKVTPLSQDGQNLKGMITSLVLKLAMEGERLSTASGELKATARNVSLDPAMFQLPMPLPVLDLGPLEAQGALTRGQLRIEKLNVGAPGKDLELRITSGTVTLSDALPNTRYDLKVLLKPSDVIEKAIPGAAALLGSMATKRPDGFYSMRLTGTLASPAFPQKEP